MSKKNQKEVSDSTSRLWSSIIKNYEMIQGAQLSNSFILLMVLNASGVRSINQVFPLERAAEAFDLMMSGGYGNGRR
ncbi:MAG: hypothetical protein WAK17_21285 [Candidatus Nitrosopolaris sp.]